MLDTYGFYKCFIPAYNENPYGTISSAKVLSLDEGDPFPPDKYLKNKPGERSLVDVLCPGSSKE